MGIKNKILWNIKFEPKTIVVEILKHYNLLPLKYNARKGWDKLVFMKTAKAYTDLTDEES